MTYYIDQLYFKKNKFWMFKLMGSYTFNKNLLKSRGILLCLNSAKIVSDLIK
ncbi:MAG: hypothetical protein P8I53_01405 [Flavobacteriaceae bacterium]|nr:hypothetical protein [Flavobacteriaceae bacterium]